MAYRLNHDDMLEEQLPNNRLRLSLPAELGQGSTESICLAPGLQMLTSRFHPLKDLVVGSRMEPAEPLLMLTLALQGVSRYQSGREDLSFAAGHATASRFNAISGERRYRQNQAVTQIRFAFNLAWLEQHVPDSLAARALRSGNGALLLAHQPIAAHTLLSAWDLADTQLAAPWQNLFQYGQALALIALELSRLDSTPCPAGGQAERRNRQCAERARDILYAEYQNPPTLAELARRCGVNGFKLKQLFHCYFHATPGQLLTAHRMNLAYHWLKHDGLPVGLTAERAGYRHAANFSAAFSRHFGFTPKQVMGKKPVK